jgi:isoleucyl-tRNA synthetase
MPFNTLKDNFTIPSAEEKILAFWDAEQVFHKAHQQALERPNFVFFEGPPTANGRPGIHHVISRTFKDLVCRYKAMRGFRVDRKGGWDTHGLPVELEVEKKLGLDSKNKVVEYGVEQFNQKCRESVFTYLKDWNHITNRMGYWLDLDDAYVTLNNNYIESVWWILKQFYDRGLMYQGFKTLPFCPRCETGLSSHEVAQGYDLVKDPSIYIKVKAADGDFSYLVWTTTPWTLPSNAALCLKPDADYVIVDHEGEKLLLAEALVQKVFGAEQTVISRHKGADFSKRRYVPLFDTFKDQAEKAYYVVTGEFVTLDDGTGIVHIAPGFGADDYEVGLKHGLPVFQAIEPNGHFKDFTGRYKGMWIKDADPIIIKDLKIAGRLFKKEQYEHNYPFCWRCDSPLIYIARQSWYIRTTQFRNQLIANNNAINWVPDEIRTGRMLNWLENNVDWAISRERFWGTPLPLWICEERACGKTRAVGSIEQLRKEGIDVPVEVDLHKPMMDRIKLRCECGGTMQRVPEVIDVWFDSGAMPYAQWHYPFENKERFESQFPADFICEAVDQTRGWFYSLLAISTMLFDKPPFRNVVVLEFILDKEGKKMSKHKGNVVDPFTTIATYGVDPVRWYLVTASNPWLPTRFDLEGIAEVSRKLFDTLRNTYSFFTIYANIDTVLERADKEGVTVDAFLSKRAGAEELFDRWIVSKFNSLVKEVTARMDAYDVTPASRAIQYFVIEELSNWYVRNNRRRFWANDDDPSKLRAYLTLHRILAGVCQLSAPVAPFISELIWTELMGANRTKQGLPLSVHMTSFPIADESKIDNPLETQMGLAEKIVSLGRAARSRKNLKVRQPLSKLLVKLPKDADIGAIVGLKDVILDELNIKELGQADDIDKLVTFSAKLNFRVAGAKLGANVKAAQAWLASADPKALSGLVQTGRLTFTAGGNEITLTNEDVEVVRTETEGYAIEYDGGVAIALVTDLTPDLIDEGFAREMVNKIQNMRKTSGFEVTDSITVKVKTTERLRSAATRHQDFIRRETLALAIDFVDQNGSNGYTEWNINGESAAILVAKS